jgi:hypothetical protein
MHARSRALIGKRVNLYMFIDFINELTLRGIQYFSAIRLALPHVTAGDGCDTACWQAGDMQFPRACVSRVFDMGSTAVANCMRIAVHVWSALPRQSVEFAMRPARIAPSGIAQSPDLVAVARPSCLRSRSCVPWAADFDAFTRRAKPGSRTFSGASSRS